MNVQKLWFDNERIYIQTADDQALWQSLMWYPRLMSATDDERADYRLNSFGIHWPSIDEDVSFESFAFEPREPDNTVSRVMKSLPEIKISQLARRIGIPQSVLAAYICGSKTPSKARVKQIEDSLHDLGQSLLAISFK